MRIEVDVEVEGGSFYGGVHHVRAEVLFDRSADEFDVRIHEWRRDGRPFGPPKHGKSRLNDALYRAEEALMSAWEVLHVG